MTQDAILLDVAPEMASVDPDKRSRFLDYAAGQLGQVYGTNQDLATAYMAAHMLMVSTREGLGGRLVSRKSGDTAEEYQRAIADDALMATAYGQALKALSKQFTFLPRNRMMSQ